MVLFKVLFILILLEIDYSLSIDLCNDWIQYKDIKCIKVLEQKGTEEEALQNCTKLDKSSTLVTIHSKDEQEYLNSLLEKYHNISIRVWLGMKYSDKSFRWIDGDNIDYNNWADDAVKDGNNPCVEMSLQKETVGKWDAVPCQKNALIVCQKKQELNLNILKNALDNFIENQEKFINSIIPIGFLYTQLPNQTSPQVLWPKLKWIEVTKDYSGLFFRAEGGDSLSFGQTQQANQSSISDVFIRACDVSHGGCHYDKYTSLIRDKWANVQPGEKLAQIINFYTTGGEVRPINTAIRIFKRIQ